MSCCGNTTIHTCTYISRTAVVLLLLTFLVQLPLLLLPRQCGAPKRKSLACASRRLDECVVPSLRCFQHLHTPLQSLRNIWTLTHVVHDPKLTGKRRPVAREEDLIAGNMDRFGQLRHHTPPSPGRATAPRQNCAISDPPSTLPSVDLSTSNLAPATAAAFQMAYVPATALYLDCSRLHMALPFVLCANF